MKILIVDDHVGKAGRLASLLEGSGIAREDIEIVVCAMKARERMRAARFDLLVVDLLLPLREADAPSVETAIDLIAEVEEREIYLKPRRVVGFTAFPEAKSRAAGAFQRRLWTIVQYDPTSSEWEEQFRGVAEYLTRLEGERAQHTYETDLCVIAALPIELAAVHALPWDWEGPQPLDDTTFIQRGTFMSQGQQRAVVSVGARRMGSVAAALLTSKLIERFHPRFVVMPGLCAGVRGEANLGDTVLMDPVWEWPSGKIVGEDGGSYLKPAPHQIALSEFVVARAEQLRDDEAFWAALPLGFKGRQPSEPVRLRIGPGASGSAVVADNATVAAIKSQHRKLMALDMEAYGVCAAARASAGPRPTAMVMKSVCDFADEAKTDTWQAFAAFTSARAIATFFERGMSEMAGLAGS